MKVSIKDLRRRDGIAKVIIESVDLSIYIARAVIDDREYLISDVDGSVLKTRNLMTMKEQLHGLPILEMVLLQRRSKLPKILVPLLPRGVASTSSLTYRTEAGAMCVSRHGVVKTTMKGSGKRIKAISRLWAWTTSHLDRLMMLTTK